MSSWKSEFIKADPLPPYLRDLYERLLRCDVDTPTGRRTVKSVLFAAAAYGVRIDASVSKQQEERPTQAEIAEEAARIRESWTSDERRQRKYRVGDRTNHILEKMCAED